MGILKKHMPIYSIQAAHMNNTTPGSGTINTFTWKDISGNERTTIGITASSSASTYGAAMEQVNQKTQTAFTIRNLIPVFTADVIGDYSIYDYEVTAAGTTTYSVNRALTNDTTNNIYNCYLNYSVTVLNDTEDAITVGCVRFKKTIQYGSGQNDNAQALIYSYYLDEPITLGVGEATSVAINFEIKV